MRILANSTALLMAAVPALGLWPSSSQATTFSFDDEYYITSTTRPYQSVSQNAQATFGTSNGAGSAGIYQGNGNCVPANCLGSTQLMNVGSSSGFVAGEFAIVNGAFTNQELALNGFGQSLNNGQQVDTVFNKSIAPFIRYTVGGVTNQTFTFNSFDLRGGASTITVQGALNGSVIFSKAITLTNTFQTFTFNWANIDTVEFAQNFGGTDAITMDNVVINNAVQPMPEPSSLALLGAGLLGIPFVRRRLL